MWQHILNLLSRSWHNFTELLGSTTLGFISPFLVPVIGLLVYTSIVLRRQGWQAMTTHIRSNLTFATIVAIAAELIVYVPIFIFAVLQTIYTDHNDLVTANKGYKSRLQASSPNIPSDAINVHVDLSEVTELKKQLEAAKNQIIDLQTPKLDKYKIYQDNEAIGVFKGIAIIPPNGLIKFGIISASHPIDFSKDMDILGAHLQCQETPASGSVSFGAIDEISYPNVLCKTISK